MEQSIDVRAIRAKLGLTQAQLGDAVGVDQSTVSNWENGIPPRGPARKLLQSLAANASERAA
ncbi:helix-turn-helix domain-containing protein [Mesorhizobium japonicum]|uniref:Helix-turn-helix transcriptional regulator n=1 Tax=Mesorhizobium japonicum R7A TaxID=935547 RepID=A0ABX6MW65_9HYPH|nr:helix-turn-helix transcriptional regulator [Mesorhizobium japonicum]PBB11162.1 XRE family transcriptional regulator [Mesorhizobium loti]QGX79440.1 XRE family transcriptional regulator [Mesorhizobium japonicum R7A]MBE1714309.1 helix-turn-helix transcriptional regulator [Mesorhizobium japonicum]MUT25290.1 helix-turn-helix domain-containing protein [Mesorhizobium japonicum]